MQTRGKKEHGRNVQKGKKPKISIITVVYNSRKFIEKTILSIVQQKCRDFEYLVIDGGSTDGTLEVIEKYEHQIDKWICEPDKGIYDAMNKAINIAEGDFLWFINSGDLIFSQETVCSILKFMEQKADIIYGETEIIDQNGETVGMRRLKSPNKLNWKKFRYGMLVCHQSILIRRTIVSNFNLRYKYSADFDWVIDAMKKTDNIANTQLKLSKFMKGGQTAKTILPGLVERFRIMTKYYGLISTVFSHFYIFYRLISHLIARKKTA